MAELIARATEDGRERRFYVEPVEVRADGEDGAQKKKIVGYAAVFGQETEIGGFFREVIEPGAFGDTIKTADVRALFNHDENLVLGRTKNKTLTLKEDGKGLRYEAEPPDTTAGRDVLTLIERGDVSQSSFGFIVREQSWEHPKNKAELPLRHIRKADLLDVSPVTFPAYPTTSVQARSDAQTHRAEPQRIQVADEQARQQLALARARVDLELADDGE